MTDALDELRDELVVQGWQPVGQGARLWSFTYVRPGSTWPNLDGNAHRLPGH